MFHEHSDIEIINTVLAGDTNAFAALLKRYEHHVAQRVAAHVPPEHIAELSHEAFIRAYKSLSRYKPIKPFGNWLSTIAVRTCHDFWRVQYRRRELPVCDMSDNSQQWMDHALSQDCADAFEALTAQRETREILDAVLDHLPPLDRMVLTLHCLEEHTVKETAEMLNISVANVKIRAFRSKKKLRPIVESLLQPRRGA